MPESFIENERASQELLACAARVAETIDGNEDYAEVIGQIAVQFARQDEFELGVRLGDSIDDPYLRDQILAEIAVVAAGAGDHQYATELLDSIDDYSFQTLAKGRIAVADAEKGELEKSLSFANQLDDPSGTLADIAIRLAKLDRFDEAIEVAESAGFPGAQAWAFIEIANRYAELERKEEAVAMLDRALDVSHELELVEERVTLWQDITGPLYGAGRREKAAELLDESAEAVPEVESEVVRDQLLVRIIEGYAMMHRYERAEELTETLEDPLAAVSAMTKVANSLDLAGDLAEDNDGTLKQRARALVGEAWKLLNETKVWEERSYVTKGALSGAIAATYLNLGEIELALQIAREIQTPASQAESLGDLALRFSLRGDLPSAFRAIEAVGGESARTVRWLNLSMNLKGDHPVEAAECLQRAEATAAEIEFPGQQTEAYARVGLAHPDGEERRALLSKALRIGSEIKQPRPQSVGLLHLAQAYAAAKIEPDAAERELLREAVVRLKR